MASSSALLAIPTFLARVAWSAVVGAVGVAGTWTVIALAIQLYHHKYPEPPPPVSGIGPMRESSVAAKQLYSKVFAEHHAKLTAERDRQHAAITTSSTAATVVTTTARFSPAAAASLNAAMARLLGYIQRDFVAAWFAQISDDPTFLAIVDTRLQSASTELSRRITHLQLDTLLVEQVVPALIAHLVEFRRAEQAVRGGTGDAEDRILTESLELQELVASKYLTSAVSTSTSRRSVAPSSPPSSAPTSLHPALHLNGSTHLTEVAYLRSIADRLLSLVLPNAPEMSSPITRSLVREILANTVLKPVMDMLSDPYFWNNLVDHWAGKAVRELAMVLRFRQVLERQTAGIDSPGTLAAATSPSVVTVVNVTTARSHEDLLKSIKTCKSLIEAKQIRNQIIMQVRRRRLDIMDRLPTDVVSGVKVTDIIKHMNKLLEAKSKVEKRIEALGGPAYVHRNRTVGLSSQHLSLSQLLASPAGLGYFMEFLDQTKRTNLLQFWLMAQSFREHLAALTVPLSSSAAADSSNTADSNNKLVAMIQSDVQSMYSSFFAPNACPQFIQLPLHLSLQVTELLATIASFDAAPIATHAVTSVAAPSLSAAAATAASSAYLYQPILDAQTYVFQLMESQDFASFVKSDLYLSLINDPAFSLHAAAPAPTVVSTEPVDYNVFNNEPVPSSLPSSSAVPISPSDGASGDALDLRQLTEEALLPTDAVESVAAELRSILTTTTPATAMQDSIPLSPSPSFPTAISELGSTDHGDSPGPAGNLLRQRSGSYSSTRSRLSVGSVTSVSSSLPPASVVDTNNTHARAAGLRQELDRLVQQEAIVDSLLASAKRSGKNTELVSVLTKSKATLRDEMRELLWLEIQQDNRAHAQAQAQAQAQTGSAFGMMGGGECSVTVVAHRLESDPTTSTHREYAVYVVQVRHVLDGATAAGPGWTVARRFSEFLSLHSALKSQFPHIMARLELPKKAPNAIFGATMLSALAASRKDKLAKYLEALCLHPQVCASQVFRSFICQEDLVSASVGRILSSSSSSSLSSTLASGSATTTAAASRLGQSGVALVKSWQKKIVSGIESLGSAGGGGPGASDAAAPLVSSSTVSSSLSSSTWTSTTSLGAPSSPSSLSSPPTTGPAPNSLFLRPTTLVSSGATQPATTATAAATTAADPGLGHGLLQGLVSSFGGSSESVHEQDRAADAAAVDSASDVLSDLFIEIFELKEKNNWLRRQAIVIVLQQLLGETIDRKVTGSIEHLTSPEMLESYLASLTDSLWPNGQWCGHFASPCDAERARVKQSAKNNLMLLIPETMGSIVGGKNATKGAMRLFSLMQNQLLNRHILYTLVDILVEALAATPPVGVGGE